MENVVLRQRQQQEQEAETAAVFSDSVRMILLESRESTLPIDQPPGHGANLVKSR